MTLTPDQEFARCVNVVLQKEGWDAYTNNPKDSGGPTKYGITLATLSAFRKHPCSAEEVQSLGEDEALAIYRANYWHIIAGDQLPAGVNLMTFDCAVNQGPGHAIRWLQAAAGCSADGVIGPATLAAVTSADPAALIEKFKQERLQAYESSPGWATFGHGWTNRDNDISTQATVWATAQ